MNGSLSPRAKSGTVGEQRPLTELEKARAEIKRFRADAAAAQERADTAQKQLLKSGRGAKVRLRVTAAIMMTAALTKIAWTASDPDLPVTPLSPITTTTAPSTASAWPSPGGPKQIEADAAMGRLLTAFHSFPDQDQPAVVREVNRRYAGSSFACPMAWNDGLPALSLRDNGTAEPMMGGALKQCAAGVEKLRLEIK
jgi:hypothetical protein